MKNKFLISVPLGILTLILIAVLGACASGYVDVTAYDGVTIYDDTTTYEEDGNSYIYAEAGFSTDNLEIDDNYSPEEASIEPEERIATVASYKYRPLPIEGIFMGGGPYFMTGGDGLDWYYLVFHIDFYFIPTNVINMVGGSRFSEWRSQFAYWNRDGWRDPREWGLRTLIEEFGISKDDIIRGYEDVFGLSMAEIDERVTWARNVDIPSIECADERWMAGNWLWFKSLSDIEALFSNDVNTIWAAFPGFGILHNNRAYSPEWLLNNIERAIYGELIPLNDLENVINTAVNTFGFVNDLTDTANFTLQTAIAAFNSPTAQTLTFSLNPIQDNFAPLTEISPSTITQTTINAWDEILNTLSTQRADFPISGPTRPGYDFMGWYLDENFTTLITDTFRMPARDVTLHARWQPSANPNAPQIQTAILPSIVYGDAGEVINYTLQATGAQPITWSIASGSLPLGVHLNPATGVISSPRLVEPPLIHMPMSYFSESYLFDNIVHNFYFTVMATNAYGSSTKELSIAMLRTYQMPNAFVGHSYSHTLPVVNTENTNWFIVSGSLPSGLVLDPDTGRIHGIPSSWQDPPIGIFPPPYPTYPPSTFETERKLEPDALSDGFLQPELTPGEPQLPETMTYRLVVRAMHSSASASDIAINITVHYDFNQFGLEAPVE